MTSAEIDRDLVRVRGESIVEGTLPVVMCLGAVGHVLTRPAGTSVAIAQTADEEQAGSA